MTCDEVKALLNAYLDGELEPSQQANLKMHLAGCEQCAADFEQLRSVQAAVRNEMEYSTAPAALRDSIRFTLRGAKYLDTVNPKPRWQIWSVAAAGFVVCGLLSTQFVVNQRSQRTLVAGEFISAHQRALMGRAVDVVSSDQHTVKPWFNGKLPFSPPVVDLAPEGFPLEGGRLDYVSEKTVAALVYRRRLHRIDVFVWPSEGQSAPSNLDRGGFREISWTKDNFSFTAVSDLNAEELAAFAELLKKNNGSAREYPAHRTSYFS